MSINPTRYGPLTQQVVAALQSVSTVDPERAVLVGLSIDAADFDGCHHDWSAAVTAHPLSTLLPAEAAVRLASAIAGAGAVAGDGPNPVPQAAEAVTALLRAKIIGILLSDSHNLADLADARMLQQPWDGSSTRSAAPWRRIL